ncbi:Abi family protein [Jonesia quinghaiensis]|uniref:Abi family protein n=1 Tax=Jonesia quinghaiensis TaxID=262806 RepID=UPI0004066745|nr:Abi family protein [Jonesia quinghaiensis]
MTSLDSTYAKPFLTVPAQIRRLRDRGMDCETDAFATAILERYGYYRLSGYWHPYRELPAPPAPRVDADGREIRLDTFVPDTSLAHVVALYDFDQALRTRLSELLSTIEISLRFFIGHRLGGADKFAHRNPVMLETMRQVNPGDSPEPTTSYNDWLEEYDRHETRARDAFVLHFRKKYGPHLPIWVATEVMSFGVLSNLYTLMPQLDQEILAARFQVNTADGKGDRGALANWLNSLRNVRNICAHYGRIWNRAFDVIIDAPGHLRIDPDHHLSRLADKSVTNKLYGVLLIMQHLLLSIAPDRRDVPDLLGFIDEQSRVVGFDLAQLGFPENWTADAVWGTQFELDQAPMRAASLLDRAQSLTAVETRDTLTSAKIKDPDKQRTAPELSRAHKAAQRQLLRTYLHYKVVIEIGLGKTKHYPAFQFRDGKIINALAEINQALIAQCGGVETTQTAAALLDWWQTPHPGLPTTSDGTLQSPADLLATIPETDFTTTIKDADAVNTFVVPETE